MVGAVEGGGPHHAILFHNKNVPGQAANRILVTRLGHRAMNTLLALPPDQLPPLGAAPPLLTGGAPPMQRIAALRGGELVVRDGAFEPVVPVPTWEPSTDAIRLANQRWWDVGAAGALAMAAGLSVEERRNRNANVRTRQHAFSLALDNVTAEQAAMEAEADGGADAAAAGEGEAMPMDVDAAARGGAVATTPTPHLRAGGGGSSTTAPPTAVAAAHAAAVYSPPNLQLGASPQLLPQPARVAAGGGPSSDSGGPPPPAEEGGSNNYTPRSG